MTEPVVRPIDAVNEVEVEGTRGTSIQILLGPEEGVPNFATRRFTIQPGGRIPCHRHDFIEHEQVVLEGTMILGLDDNEVEASAGDCVFIPAGVAHWYENRGEVPVRFLCMVPMTDEYQTEWLEPPIE
jgi:quercetin dioxygenase-like cupin family protein